MTTLEKLCRAACEAEGRDPDDLIFVSVGVWDWFKGASSAQTRWQCYIKSVLAVLTALEDPSDEMAIIGSIAGPRGPFLSSEELETQIAKAIFTAMIRKAKEG